MKAWPRGWAGKVRCGDSIELMEQMPSRAFGLIVTSPPYNILQTTGGGFRRPAGKWRNAALRDGYLGHGDALPEWAYIEWQRAALAAMMRVLRDDGAIFYNHKWRVQDGLLQDRAEIVRGFPVRQVIIWQRDGGLNFNRGYFVPTYEVIYLIANPGFKLAEGASGAGDVWKIHQDRDNPHPAPFPVELVRRCISATTAELVLDPYLGSGSTAIAAEACGRQWVGIDNAPAYCRMARQRIRSARGRKGARP